MGDIATQFKFDLLNVVSDLFDMKPTMKTADGLEAPERYDEPIECDLNVPR